MIIGLEGIDGSGKTTLSLLLSSTLEYNQLSFPYYDNMPIIKEYLTGNISLDGQTSFMLFATNIVQNQDKVKDNIIIDRYIYSTLAYTKYDYIKSKNIIDNLSLKHADIVFLLDISPNDSIKRRMKHPQIYDVDIPFLQTVRNRFLQMANDQYKTKWVIIDATKKPTLILEEILSFLRNK